MAALRLGALFGRPLGVLRSAACWPAIHTVVNVDSTAFPVAPKKQNMRWQNLIIKANYSNQPVEGENQTCASVDPEGQTLNLSWKDGSSSRFHSVWLRHNCHCGQCRQQHSGQRTTDPTSVPHDIPITSVTVTGGDVELEWGGEGHHKGVIPVDYLQQHCYLPASLHKQRQAVALDTPAKTVPEMDYEELMSGKAGVLKWLRQINESGLSVLSNVPTQQGMVMKVAQNAGPVDDLIYGKMFDVVSVPKPINIAYSGVALDFHMDLVYYESPPGLQFLHCMRFDDSVVGGESRFLDVFSVAEEFKSSNPEHFSTLVRVPATFQKFHYDRDYPVEMKYQRPHIVINQYEEVVGVNWAPSFEGPLAVPQDDVVPYYAAYQAFAKAIKFSPHILEYHLKPGDLVTFNNRRILHARREFELNGGGRHLQGCYVNIDHFKNSVAVYSRLYGDSQPTKRVGNNDWF